MTPTSDTALHMNRTICVCFCQVEYELIIQKTNKFREEIDKASKKHPELFPSEINSGFKMKANCAFKNDTPCLSWLALSLLSSHSK